MEGASFSPLFGDSTLSVSPSDPALWQRFEVVSSVESGSVARFSYYQAYRTFVHHLAGSTELTEKLPPLSKRKVPPPPLQPFHSPKRVLARS